MQRAQTINPITASKLGPLAEANPRIIPALHTAIAVRYLGSDCAPEFEHPGVLERSPLVLCELRARTGQRSERLEKLLAFSERTLTFDLAKMVVVAQW